MEPEQLAALVTEARDERRSAFTVASSEEDSLLLYPQLHWLGVRFTNVWLRQLEDQGKFPRRMKISTQTNAWSSREIQAWLEAHKAARPQVTTEKNA